MATLDEQDLNNIKLLIDVYLDEKLDAKLDEKIGKLPTKEEYAAGNDKLIGELKKSREEQTTLSQHSKDHTDEIDKLKKIHPNYQHPTSNI